MAFVVDDDGTITTYQGDSGQFVITGLDTTQNYKVYFAIQDKKRNFIGNELMANSLYKDTVTFNITADITDKLTVPTNKNFETYYYGTKKVTPGTNDEDTMFIGDGEFGTQNMIIVYPKKVEGVK